MLNLSRSSNYSNHTFHSEIGDRENSDRDKIRLPRHISALESPSHSVQACPSPLQAVRQCPLKQRQSAEATNLAVNILRFQLQDRSSQRKHLENLRSSLMRRLQAAQSAKNSQLVTMLEEEFRQLEASI